MALPGYMHKFTYSEHELFWEISFNSIFPFVAINEVWG